MDETPKRCSKCEVYKPREAFNKNSKKRDGLQNYCRDCSKARAEDWYRDNTDEHRTRARRWKADNPERVAEHRRNRASRLKQAGGGSFDPDRLDYQERVRLYGGRCAFCGERESTTLDHGVPVSKNGSNHASNIFPVCILCQLEKHAKVLFRDYTPYCFGLDLRPGRLP